MCVRRATVDDAAALSDFAAAIFPLGCAPGSDPRDLAQGEDFGSAELVEDEGFHAGLSASGA